MRTLAARNARAATSVSSVVGRSNHSLNQHGQVVELDRGTECRQCGRCGLPDQDHWLPGPATHGRNPSQPDQLDQYLSILPVGLGQSRCDFLVNVVTWQRFQSGLRRLGDCFIRLSGGVEQHRHTGSISQALKCIDGGDSHWFRTALGRFEHGWKQGRVTAIGHGQNQQTLAIRRQFLQRCHE